MDTLFILFVSSSADDESVVLRNALDSLGHETVSVAPSAHVLDHFQQRQFDVIVVHDHKFDLAEWQILKLVTERNPLPVLVFSDLKSDSGIEEILGSGISSYVQGESSFLRVQAMIDVCIERFRQTQQLTTALAESRAKLNERKLVERAKGLIMTQKGLDEAAAYNHLRKAAMNEGKSMGVLAEQVIKVFELMD